MKYYFFCTYTNTCVTLKVNNDFVLKCVFQSGLNVSDAPLQFIQLRLLGQHQFYKGYLIALHLKIEISSSLAWAPKTSILPIENGNSQIESTNF